MKQLYLLEHSLKYGFSVIMNKNHVFMVHLLLSIFILVSTSYASEIRFNHYLNQYSGCAGLFYSNGHQLIFSTISGLYSLDPDTGQDQILQNNEGTVLTVHRNIFEFQDKLYCYDREKRLLRYDNDELHSIASMTMAHRIWNNKLYVFNQYEPKYAVSSGDTLKALVSGIEGSPEKCEFEVVGDDCFCLEQTNNMRYYLFRFRPDSLEILFSPDNEEYDAVFAYKSETIFSADGKLYLSSENGVWVWDGETFIPLDESYTFTEDYSFCIHGCGSQVIGITERGIYRSDLSSKETVYMYCDSIHPDMGLEIKQCSSNRVYIKKGDSLFCYQSADSSFLPCAIDSAKILAFIEDDKGNLIISRDNKLEWYKPDGKKVYSGDDMSTNDFYSITYDKYKHQLVTYGLKEKQFVLQIFDGKNWNMINSPFRDYSSDSYVYGQMEMVTGPSGAYYLGTTGVVSRYMNNSWDRLNMRKYKEDTTTNIHIRSHILALDSNDGLWVGAYITEHNPHTGAWEVRNTILRWEDDNMQIILDSADKNWASYFTAGVCLRNGDVVVQTEEDSLYYYSKGVGRFIGTDDNSDFELENDYTRLFVNARGQLVVLFETVIGAWHKDYGVYSMDGSIAVYDNGKWDHDYYMEKIRPYDSIFTRQKLVPGADGNDYYISRDFVMKITPDGQTKKFDLPENPISWHDSYCQYGNNIWITNRGKGIYYINLTGDSLVFDYPEPDKVKIVDDVLSGDYAEFKVDISQYSVFSVDGKLIMNGDKVRKINISRLAIGVYFIVADYKGRNISQKFMRVR